MEWCEVLCVLQMDVSQTLILGANTKHYHWELELYLKGKFTQKIIILSFIHHHVIPNPTFVFQQNTKEDILKKPFGYTMKINRVQDKTDTF